MAEFKWLRFQHEAQEFLVRFRFENNGTTIKPFTQQDFIGMKLLKASVSKDQPAVDIPDMANEQVVIGQSLFEIDGPNLFTVTNGHNHETQGWR